MTTPAELYRRFSEKIERRKTLTLSADDLDLFVAMGGYDALSKAAAEWARNLAEDRIAVRKAEREEAMEKAYRAQYPRPHPDPEVEAACRRAWEACQPKRRPRF